MGPAQAGGRVEILVAVGPGEIRAAAVHAGALVDYAVSRAGASGWVGDRMRGRVLAHLPALAGAFVGLPGGMEGFLPDSRGGAGPGGGGWNTGDAVTVVVTRAPQGGKGARLSVDTAQAGTGPPELLDRGPDAVARLLALHPGAAMTVDDPAAAHGAAAGAAVVARAWGDALEDQVAALAGVEVALPGGMRATVHPTPALVAIDVDGAGASGERRAKAGAQRDANRAALPALARAIRLRNLGGAVVLDLAGMAVKARAALGPDLVAALAGDPLRPRFLGFSALGLAEILRPRVHPPLHELLAGPHAAGLRGLRMLARQAAAAPASLLRLRTTPAVAGALDGDVAARTDLARRTGRPLVLVSDPALMPDTWIVEASPRG